MTLSEFCRQWPKEKQRELDEAMRTAIPKQWGSLARDHFMKNFRKGGFVNNGLQKWTPTKRQLSGRKGAGSKYGPLLSGHNNLYSSISYTPMDRGVRIYNNTPYAGIHNDGFSGQVSVKPHTRKVSSLLSLKGQRELRKKEVMVRGHTRNMNIPQRQFMGDSAELRDKMVSATAKMMYDILVR